MPSYILKMKPKTQKRAQLEIMQSAIVLMIILFMLAIAAIFFFAQQKTSTSKQLDQLLIISQMKKSKNIALLPEVQFSSDNVIVSDHYDKLALLSFKKVIDDNPLTYKQLLANTKITLSEYSYTNGWKEMTIVDYSPDDFTSKREFQIPVALTEPDTYNKTVGIIYVEIFN